MLSNVTSSASTQHRAMLPRRCDTRGARRRDDDVFGFGRDFFDDLGSEKEVSQSIAVLDDVVFDLLEKLLVLVTACLAEAR